MNAQRITLILRLCAGLGLSGFGIVSGLVQWAHGDAPRGFATAVIYALLACIVAPLAEDIDAHLRRSQEDPDT